MGNIHISRAGATIGNFAETEVREGLRSGRFLGSDLAWREGMAAWQPLASFAEFAADTPAAAPGAAPLVPAVPIARDGLPWERRAQLGTVPAFVETVKLVLLKPADAFAMMKTEGGMGDPLLYALIGGSIGFLFYLFLTFLIQTVGIMSSQMNPFAHAFGAGIGMLFFILLIPFFIVVGLFLGAIILHLCLMLVGGAKRSFETTLRVLCFTTGSTNLLLIVPICGGAIGGIWSIVVECIGIARAHETDTGRAVLAVFLPVVLCCGGMFFFGVFFGTLGALFGHH